VHYGRALALEVDDPEEAYLNRAVILSEFLDDPDAARRDLGQAIAINPDFIPAWLNSGLLHEDEGRPDLAIASYRQILSVEPDHPEAVAKIARLDQPSGAHIDRIKTLLARGRLSLIEQADLWFALASLHDRMGDYDPAFAAASEANRRMVGTISPAARYDPAATEALVSHLLAMDVAPLAAEDAAQTPVFICGMFRSGSTLAEAMLGRHPMITACGERDMLPRAFASHDLAELDRRAGQAFLSSARAMYRDGLAHLQLATSLFTDKRPDNIAHIGFAKAMFPAAKLIFTDRHPLDTLVSTYFLNFATDVAYAFDLDHMAHWAQQVERLATTWRARWPHDVAKLRYEALIADPGTTLGEALLHLGLPWDDACLDPHSSIPATRTPSSIQIRQPLYSRSVGRWRHYERHLVRQQDALAKAGLL